MDILAQGLDILLHLDTHLNAWITQLGPWIYLVLFMIFFCETGIVVTPFLPGDSLLFALGAMTSVENAVLNLPLLLVLLTVAAIAGDAVNYSIGNYFGPKIFRSEERWWLNKSNLLRTQEFYEKHGGKTIILARFIPIIRTFAPFVAGIGKMKYSRFALYNVAGAISWVVSILVAGHFFGNMPIIKRNFHIVIVAIIGISVLPIFIEWIRSRCQNTSTSVQ